MHRICQIKELCYCKQTCCTLKKLYESSVNSPACWTLSIKENGFMIAASYHMIHTCQPSTSWSRHSIFPTSSWFKSKSERFHRQSRKPTVSVYSCSNLAVFLESLTFVNERIRLFYALYAQRVSTMIMRNSFPGLRPGWLAGMMISCIIQNTQYTVIIAGGVSWAIPYTVLWMCVAPPTVVGVWSMLWQPVEYYYYYTVTIKHEIIIIL